MRILLFTSQNCPHCPPAKELLMKSGIPNIEFINATENMNLVKEFKIRSVPTLVVLKDEKNESYTGSDAIEAFIKTVKKV